MIRAQSSKRAFTRGRALALLPLSLLTVLGCAQIIGLGDYSVGSGAGAGGTVAGGGKSGGSGKAGSSNANGGESNAGEGGAAAGETGTSGTAGSSGTVGVAGEGGEAGGGGAIIPPAVGCDGVTPITLNQDVMRSCILRVSCDPYDPLRTISTCVTNNTQDAFAGEHCNLKSTTCAEFEACEHIGIAGDDLCPASKSGTSFCAGTKSVTCTSDGTISSWVDCIGQGGTGCGTYTDSDGNQVADCLVNEPCSASGSTVTDYECSAEATPLYQYYCAGDQAYGFACGDFAYCNVDSTGSAGCYLTSNTCTSGGTTCPDGTTCTTANVAKVVSGGGEYDYDCGSVGLTCKVGPANADNDTNYCLAPGCKPADVNNCTEFCDGTKLNFCYGGAQVTADCMDYGFSGCEDFSGSDPAYSRCVN
jgi:hypothetical protein